MLFLNLLAALPATSLARWATYDDADTELTLEKATVEVHKDGSYVETIETKLKILKESARDNFTTRRLTYNSMSSQIQILSAKTINNGKEYPVDPQLIEDKPLASSAKGFDQQNQILIAYPQIQLQSEVYLKYKLTFKEAIIPNFFSNSFIYGNDAYESHGDIQIRSEIPLFVSVNDPDKYLKITQKDSKQPQGYRYFIQVQLKKPVYKEPTDEAAVHMDPKSLPWVDVSSVQNWPKAAYALLSDYEKILNSPLPETFQNIANEAAKQNNLTGKINVITSLLAQHVSYLGDWRPVAGHYIPRPLATIASTKLGDCKDFAASTAAILKSLKIQAHIAWVKRGLGTLNSPNDLPTLGDFNHAIVRVIDQDKTLWIDPTNFVSFAPGVFPDIAGKKTLVMDPSGIQMDQIPEARGEDSQIHLVKKINLKNPTEFKIDGELEMKGTAAIPYTGVRLNASKQSIDYGLMRAIGDETRMTHWEVEPYDLSSRVVKDLLFRFHFLEANSELRTSAGPGYVLSPSSYLPALLTPIKNRVSDLFLGPPVIVKKEIQLLNISRFGDQSLDCQIDNSWLQAIRKVSDTDTGIQIRDTFTIKKSLIPNSELRSKEYEELQEKLQKCFNGVALIYKALKK